MAGESNMTFNNAFFDDLGRSPGVAALVDAVTEAVAKTARDTAPVGETGDYRAGIIATSKLQDRHVGLVKATDPKSMIIESKTGNLARALRTHSRGSGRG